MGQNMSSDFPFKQSLCSHNTHGIRGEPASLRVNLELLVSGDDAVLDLSRWRVRVLLCILVTGNHLHHGSSWAENSVVTG